MLTPFGDILVTGSISKAIRGLKFNSDLIIEMSCQVSPNKARVVYSARAVISE